MAFPGFVSEIVWRFLRGMFGRPLLVVKWRYVAVQCGSIKRFYGTIGSIGRCAHCLWSVMALFHL